MLKTGDQQQPAGTPKIAALALACIASPASVKQPLAELLRAAVPNVYRVYSVEPLCLTSLLDSGQAIHL